MDYLTLKRMVMCRSSSILLFFAGNNIIDNEVLMSVVNYRSVEVLCVISNTFTCNLLINTLTSVDVSSNLDISSSIEMISNLCNSIAIKTIDNNTISLSLNAVVSQVANVVISNSNEMTIVNTVQTPFPIVELDINLTSQILLTCVIVSCTATDILLSNTILSEMSIGASTCSEEDVITYHVIQSLNTVNITSLFGYELDINSINSLNSSANLTENTSADIKSNESISLNTICSFILASLVNISFYNNASLSSIETESLKDFTYGI